jgi:hypothetical protein
LSLGQNATHFGDEMEAMPTALIQLFGRIWSFEKAVMLSDSISAMLSVAKFDALQRIHSSFKLLEGLEKDMISQWIPSYCGGVGNEIQIT